MKINLSDQVRIRLTPHGEWVWKMYFVDRGLPPPTFVYTGQPGVTADGTYTGQPGVELQLQLRELLAVFGPHWLQDAPPFDPEITLLTKDPSDVR